MKTSQSGLGFFGMLIVLAIAVAVGYYAYKGMSGGDDAPSCQRSHTACLQKCRRTATEAPAAQACQQDCRREADACEQKGK